MRAKTWKMPVPAASLACSSTFPRTSGYTTDIVSSLATNATTLDSVHVIGRAPPEGSLPRSRSTAKRRPRSQSTADAVNAGFRQRTKATRMPRQNDATPPSFHSVRMVAAAPTGGCAQMTRVATVSRGSVSDMLAQPPSVRSGTAATPSFRPPTRRYEKSRNSPKYTVAKSATTDRRMVSRRPWKRPCMPSSRVTCMSPSRRPV
mmetsp:Transcript_79260/g.224377  ORF Transcript_79260/g.224377 Transcript_79260/m.224377 type:complete len:204 (-) Transcript_79260:237-848(-)